MVDFIPEKNPFVKLQLNSSYEDIFLEVTSVPDENTIMLKNLTLEPGQYWYSIETSKVEYALLTISSKARNGETLPLRTNCWVSAEETDAQKSKLAVFAEVEQANRPVLNAQVE